MRKTATASRLVLLVTTAVFINCVDSGNLATAPPLRRVPEGHPWHRFPLHVHSLHGGYYSAMRIQRYYNQSEKLMGSLPTR